MPRNQFSQLEHESVVCYCGKTFANSTKRGYHLRACPVYRTFSPAQKEEHRERVKFFSILRAHNPYRGRYKFVMRELLNLKPLLESTNGTTKVGVLPEDVSR